MRRYLLQLLGTARTNPLRCSEGGAGNALALEFAAQGHRVFATARSLRSVANLSQKGIEVLVLDVTDAASIAALKTEVSGRTGGKLGMLFNNAGSSMFYLFLESVVNRSLTVALQCMRRQRSRPMTPR